MTNLEREYANQLGNDSLCQLVEDTTRIQKAEEENKRKHNFPTWHFQDARIINEPAIAPEVLVSRKKETYSNDKMVEDINTSSHKELRQSISAIVTSSILANKSAMAVVWNDLQTLGWRFVIWNDWKYIFPDWTPNTVPMTKSCFDKLTVNRDYFTFDDEIVFYIFEFGVYEKLEPVPTKRGRYAKISQTTVPLQSSGKEDKSLGSKLTFSHPNPLDSTSSSSTKICSNSLSNKFLGLSSTAISLIVAMIICDYGVSTSAEYNEMFEAHKSYAKDGNGDEIIINYDLFEDDIASLLSAGILILDATFERVR